MTITTEFYVHQNGSDGWDLLYSIDGAVPNLHDWSMVLHNNTWYKVRNIETHLVGPGAILQIVLLRYIRPYNLK